MMTTAAVADALTRLVAFDPPDRPVEDVVDELGALHLYARRNGAPERLVDLLGTCRHLGGRIAALLVSASANSEAVTHNFRAMVYATLDHTFLDVAVNLKHADLLTLLTTGASFVLNRLAEYSYVEAARAAQEAQLRLTSQEVAEQMWEALAANPRTLNATWEECQAYRDLIRRTRASLDAARSHEPATRFYTLLLYARLLEALEECKKWGQT